MTQPRSNTAVERVKSSLSRQRRILLIAAAAVLVLAVALGVALYFTSRITFKDPQDGTKYYIRQVKTESGKKYVIQDKSGRTLDKTTSGNYVTASGTIVYVNSKDGSYSTVAAVLTEDSETVRFDTSNAKYDVLLYPMLERDSITSIEVVNEKDHFRFIKLVKTEDQSEYFVLEDRPDISVSTTTSFATLVSCTGYTRTLLRLDTEKVKELGYAEYGLPENPDDATKYFIITDKTGKSHKVILGDEVPSGQGYYARYAGRDAVYVLRELETTQYNITIAEALFGTVETYVVPVGASKNMTSTNYFDVSNFELYRKGQPRPLIAFSYSGSHTMRNNTFYASTPYVTDRDLKGYTVNEARVDDCLLQLCEWTPGKTASLFRKEDGSYTYEELQQWLSEYGLDNDSYAYRISFIFNQNRTYNAEKDRDELSKKDQEKHEILISARQEDGTYYVYNLCATYNEETREFDKPVDGYNMVVAINYPQMEFLSWDTKEWIESTIFSNNIAYLTELSIKAAACDTFPGGYTGVFHPDNTATIRDLEAKTNHSGAISSDKMTVADGNGKALDVTQFKRFYQELLCTSLVGYSSLPEETQQAYRNAGAAGAQLTLKLTYTLLKYNAVKGVYEATGETVVREYCFYRDYAAPREIFTTVNGVGDFYISRTRFEKILRDIGRLYNPDDPIDPNGTY